MARRGVGAVEGSRTRELEVRFIADAFSSVYLAEQEMQTSVFGGKRHGFLKLHLSLWKLIALQIHVPEMFANTRVLRREDHRAIEKSERSIQVGAVREQNGLVDHGLLALFSRLFSRSDRQMVRIDSFVYVVQTFICEAQVKCVADK
jgi:hypothetical protein